MTLKEKFKDVLINPIWQMTMIDKQMEITNNFAIGFAEWCADNYFRMGNTSFWAESMDWDTDNKFTTKELLETYKKEKGL
jgi:hypothetical protein